MIAGNLRLLSLVRSGWRAKAAIGTLLALAGTAHTVRNLQLLRTAPALANAGCLGERIAVLLPVRDEEHRVAACLRSLRNQEFDELLVLDDESTDATSQVVKDEMAGDHRLVLLTTQTGGGPPAGWLGKPWACHRLAAATSADVLVFIDADVELEPSAIRRAVALLRTSDLDIICPYPRQLTSGLLGRLVQPLLQWSWLTTLPLDLAERSPRTSLAAGNGQFLLVDAAAYRRAGGHAAVAGEVIEDVALVRAMKAAGGRGGMVDGTDLARCQMYASSAELSAGYTKSLWDAFGSPAGATAAILGLSLAYLVPPAALFIGPTRFERTIGAVGYLAAVSGRLLVARRTRQRMFPDALAHPLSIATFSWLTAESFRLHRQGTLRWRGRAIP